MSNEKVPGYTVDDVKKLSDLRQARKLLKENHISLEGLQSLWDCKDRLNQYLKKCNDPVSNDGAFTRGADVLQEILQEDKEKRNELLMLYTEVQSYTKTINDSNKEHLKNNVEYYEQKLVDFVSQLQKNDCPILVAGETSSGKSTLLNLILGADILPVSLLSSTSVICELKYGDKKRAVVHKVDGSKTEVNDLGDGEADCLEKLSVYIHMENDREKGSPYNRVEIFWPFPLLRGGLFIVDSPGIGENREMTKQVMEYLPNAFGFIYVINSANAGGVQKDRLQKLLRSVAVSNDGEQLKTFDPRSAIFVCNKWDQVPANEEELVKKDTLDKLRSCWTGLEDEQVFFVSTQKAATSIKAVGFPSSDFDMLLDGIQKLLPISVKYKLQIYYDWLAYLMSRSALQLRTKLYNASMSAVEMADRFKYIQDRLAKCTLDTERVFREIESDLEMRKREIVDSLLHYLKVDCRDAVSHWTEADGPDLKSWDALQKHVRMLILRRLEGLVYEWDGDNMWFQKSRQQLQVDFRKKFGLLQDYLSEVEEAMSVGRSFELKPFGEHDSLPASSGMSKSTKIALGASSPILVPIAVVASVFLVPAAGIYAIHRKVGMRKKLEDYRKNKVEYLKEISIEVLEEFCERDNLTSIVQDQFDDIDFCLLKLRSLVPRIIAADANLMESVKRDRAMATFEKDTYTKLFRICHKLQGKLNLFHIERIREFEFDFNDLQGWNPMSAIASGSFADVYHASLRRRDDVVQIALKVFREHVTPDTVNDYLTEETALRKLASPYVVEFHGSAFSTKPRKQLAMAFELCVGLKDFIFSFDDRIPAKHEPCTKSREIAFNFMKDFSKQLTRALAFVHEKGFIHRDMKIDNILVDNQNRVKLADLGLTKRDQDITHSFVGSVYYMPPEMLTAKKYNYKADIYSLGLIFWEMWYGEYAYEDEDSSMLEFINKIKDNYRPDLKKPNQPSYDMCELIKRCWHQDPDRRPTASECLEAVERVKD